MQNAFVVLVCLVLCSPGIAFAIIMVEDPNLGLILYDGVRAEVRYRYRQLRSWWRAKWA
jgi:hypothetical protein